MSSDATQRLLTAFGEAALNLEAALDRRATLGEIAEYDRILADRTREVINHVEMLRSRRIW